MFGGVSFAVARGDCLGIVGRNGEGKTTLFRAIAGQLAPEEGSVQLARGARCAFLEQVPELCAGQTVLAEAETALAGLIAHRTRLADVAARMSDEVDPELLEEYGRLAASFESAGGYAAETRLRQTLFGLGFRDRDLDTPVARLSGGQRVRLALAKLLLSEPDLLLLDEPTNHLDIQGAEWLSQFLKAFRGAVVLVAHDRYFLDQVSTGILELDSGAACHYRGNYSAFVRQKTERQTREAETYARQQAEAAKLKDYIARYMAGNRSTMAKSRLKALSRMVFVPKPRQAPAMKLRLTQAELGGREVARLKGLGKAYPGRVLFSGFMATIFRGDRLGLVGPNGSGKTTLLRLLLGEEVPSEGGAEWGGGVKVGYLPQEDVPFDRPEASVLDTFMEATGTLPAEARSWLARFLFIGEHVLTPVGALSGGERTRLALARLVLSEANTLVLDEPTNHLDLRAREALEEALAGYPGTLIMVTHDRYFLDRLATRLWIFADGGVHDHQGNYSSYRQDLLRRREAPQPPPARAAQGQPQGGRKAERRDLQAVERRIEALEAEKMALESRLAEPDTHRLGQAKGLYARYREVVAETERLYGEWAALHGDEPGGGIR